jgi:hypothetical protein
MANQLALNGESEAVENVSELYQRIEDLESELRTARQETLKAKRESEDAIRAITALRAQLMPLHRALRAIFGEINLVVPEDQPVAPEGTQPRSNAPAAEGGDKWNYWKARFPGRPAEVIDLLLVQGEMNLSQLASVLRCDRSNLSKQAIFKLNKAGLIIKNGNNFSLRKG